ncbi:MAG: hypothetical protein E5W96_18485 [Mesorhizobium sp.]|nr:MAG: hypothetical protein E5W96_21040 [Mesorhizobium sp.]TIS48332.1 MAG: hypothetical protein E5W96_18485 [Mesorhizobium sp.]
MSPKATDEGCSRERRRLTPLEHPSSVSALRADPPSPTRGEGKGNHLDYRHDCCTIMGHKHPLNHQAGEKRRVEAG